MKSIIAIFIVFIAFNLKAQGNFIMPRSLNSERIEIDIVNNLVIMPVTVNGVELSFLLDTGVNTTVIFKVQENEQILVNEASVVNLSGAGSGNPIPAIKSKGNVMQVGKVKSDRQELFVIFEESLNISPRMGVPVHGIIGFNLFKDFIVEISYTNRYIKLHRPGKYKYKKCTACYTGDLIFLGNKPYIETTVSQNTQKFPVTLLLDSGSGDAVWLFQETNERITLPEKSFEDFLGLGLNGNIFGKRGRLDYLKIGDFVLEDATVAFPDTSSTRNLVRYEKRNGSLGAEVLKRFNMVIDYPNKKITLRKNKNFDLPFRYNLSGLTIMHSGFSIKKEILSDNPSFSLADEDTQAIVSLFKTTQNYQNVLIPEYEIAEIRPDSPAANVGLMVGDHILKINGKKTDRLKLDEITKYFFLAPGKTLKIGIERNGVQMDFEFQLRKII